jgi:hypothetical protein
MRLRPFKFVKYASRADRKLFQIVSINLLHEFVAACTRDWQRVVQRMHAQCDERVYAGAAAFNLLAVLGTCIVSVPEGDVRRVTEFWIYMYLNAVSVVVFIWVLVIYEFWTPNVRKLRAFLHDIALVVVSVLLKQTAVLCTNVSCFMPCALVMAAQECLVQNHQCDVRTYVRMLLQVISAAEAWITLGLFPVYLVLAYILDVRPWDKRRKKEPYTLPWHEDAQAEQAKQKNRAVANRPYQVVVGGYAHDSEGRRCVSLQCNQLTH